MGTGQPIPQRRSALRRLAAMVLATATIVSSTSVTPPPIRANEPASGELPAAAPGADGYDDRYVQPAAPAPITVLDPGSGGETVTADAPVVEDAGLSLRRELALDAAPAVRTELVEQRSEGTRLYAESDGTFTQDIAQGRLNYSDKDGEWQPIDLSLVTERADGYELAVAALDREVRFATDDAKTAFAQVALGTQRVALRSLDSGFADGTQTDDGLRFAGAGNRGDLAAIPTDTGFQFTVTLDSASDTAVYHFALRTDGLDAELSDGTVQLIEPFGRTVGGLPRDEVVGEISAPLMLERDRLHADVVSVSLLTRGADRLPATVPAWLLEQLEPGEQLLSYAIDPDWLADPDRQFPVVLDPIACIGGPASYCEITSNGVSFDEFIFSQNPDENTWLWELTRVGYDARSDDGGPYAAMRGLYYFPDVALPDGAQVTAASVRLTVDAPYGGWSGEQLQFFRVTRPWGTNSVTWNDMHLPNTGYEEPGPAFAIPGSTTYGSQLYIDAAPLVRDWYMRRTADWKPNLGLLLRMVAESSANGELGFEKFNDPTLAKRPLLTITYAVPAVGFDFAPELGANYAPSGLVAGQATKLPIIVRNTGSVAFNHLNDGDGYAYRAGYRWLDATGAEVSCPSAPCHQALPATVNPGTSSAIFTLSVTPPATPGHYTLRLDLAHVHSSAVLWASDWAKLSLYLSRNKKILSPENTRWVGSSVIERAEFGVAVSGAGGAAVGELRGVTLNGGSSLGLNLATRNLRYEGSAGVGFADLDDLALTYGYDRANVADCENVLDACGWYTNLDESFTAGANPGAYTYQAPSGDRYAVGTDGAGQLSSSAPLLLSRPRITLFDENDTTDPNVNAVLAADEGIPTYSGPVVLKHWSHTNYSYGSVPTVPLNSHRWVSLAVRTSGATGVGIDFRIRNLTDPANHPDTWLAYTVGTHFNPDGYPRIALGGNVVTNWQSVSERDVYQDALNAGIGSAGDVLQVIAMQSISNGQSSRTFVDAVRFEGRRSQAIADTMPAWTAGGVNASANTNDRLEGTQSVQVVAAAYYDSPACLDPCQPPFDLASYQWATWGWKKVGGSTIGLVFAVRDTRTGLSTSITYYAGPTPPPGAPNPLQVSPTLPAEWTRVTRNLLEDARQIGSMYNDTPLGTDPSAPPVGPQADPANWWGYRLLAGDGNFALFDALDMSSLPDVGLDQLLHPNAAGDTTFTYDFAATYPDRSRHFFNRDGLLERIIDRDGNQTNLDWAVLLTGVGQSAYFLDGIRAPSDATTSGSWTYERELDVWVTQFSGYDQVTFREKLGTTAAPITGRRADFMVADVAGANHASGDVLKVSPARHNISSCGARPSGCTEFLYADGSTHALTEVRDPRWDGSTSGANDYRFSIAYYGGDPYALVDRSRSATPQLYVVSFDTSVGSDLYRRPLVAEAAARAANRASYVELSPDGRLRVEYVPKSCVSDPCLVGTPSSHPPLPGSAERLVAHEFDGVSRVNRVQQYVTGSTYTVTRHASNPAAKVDNYADPLAAARLAWTQTRDQHFASLADTSGTNPDLYRTTLRYDGAGNLLSEATPISNRTPDYAGSVASSALAGYWRLADTGSTVADASGHGLTGTISASGVTKGVGGALARDTNTAMTFDGSSGRVTAPLSISQASYTLASWVRQTSTIADGNGHGLIGDWAAGSGALLYATANNVVAFVHGNTYLVMPNVRLAAGRWYHLAAAWDGSHVRIYLDGELVGSAAVGAAPGSGATSLEIASYSNGFATTFNAVSVDEAAVYSAALYPGRIRQQYLAGRGTAERSTQARYDHEGHPLEAHDSFIANGGFESGLTGYHAAGGADVVFGADSLPEIHTGFASLRVPAGAVVQQLAHLVPGQTARWQLGVRTDGNPATQASYGLHYWRRSTATWVALAAASHTSGTWTTKAFDVTVPLDGDGRVLVTFTTDAGGVAYFDELLVVSDWASSTWASTGLPIDRDLLQPGSAGGGVLRRHHTYAASATTPPIFATGVTDNYVNGVPDPTIPDEDVTTTRVFDAWGRVIAATDPDGVTVTSTYAANLTDVASTADELGNTTAYAYDQTGNPTSTTAPGGEVTATAYDLRGRRELATAPDGVVGDEVYNAYGQRTTSIANRRDGVPANQGSDDDLITTYAYDQFGRVIQTVADDGASGLIKAKTMAVHDLIGNQTSSTVYADSAYAEARTTTWHVAHGTIARPTPTGTRGPIPPAGAPAPACPGAGGQFCTSVTALDMNGRVTSTTDAYGVVTVVDRDVAGNVVQTIANYVAGQSATADRNVATSVAYDIAGQPARSTDAVGRDTLTTYDDLSRSVRVVRRTEAGVDHVQVRTVYTPAGRIDRVSDPGPAAAADADLTWTRTEYDAAGRAVRTLAHYDIDGDAHLVLDGFETGADRWSAAGSGWFTNGGASLGLDDAFHSVAPRTGDGRLRVATAAGSGNSGVTWDLSGQAFVAGRAYRVTADVIGWSGNTLRSFLGVDASGASYAEGPALATNGQWQTITFTWTPATTVSTDVHFAVRRDASGTMEFYLDNVSVEDVADPGWNIPTETAYDANGRVVASVLPPGTAGEDPMVTTTAYDPAGRSVAVSVNARRTYSHARIADASAEGLVAFWPLDDRAGSTAVDVPGTADLTWGGGVRLGVAGAVDEARTGVALDAGYAARSASALGSTNNFSLEAWFRLDTASGNQTIAYNGTDAAGWGLGLDATGKLAAIYGGVATLSTTQSPTLGAWHHAVLVRNAGNTTIYLDGTPFTPTSAGSAPLSPGAGFGIGRQSNSIPRYLDGAVDEVAVYATPLSGSAVTAHFTAGRPTSADERLTTRTDYDALGRAIRSTSPRGIVTAYEVDRLGRTAATVANLRDGSSSAATGDDDVRSTFAHNAAGELIGFCPARQVFAGGCDPVAAGNAQAWHYAHDPAGNLASQVPPVNTTAAQLHSRSWSYDPGGRLTTHCDFATGGSCTAPTRHADYTYDALGRQLTERIYGGSGTGSLRLGWTRTYTADGLLTSVAFDGSGSGQGSDTLTYTYSGMGRPDQVLRGATVLTDFGFNPDGMLISRVDGTLGASTFAYDWADRITSASSPLYAGSTGFTWRLDGLIGSRTWPGLAGALTASYDAAKRPSELALGATSFERTYARDGLVLAETATIGSPLVALDTNGEALAFSYDGLGRLVASDLPGTTADRAYTYDLNGNRTSASEGAIVTAYAYDRTDVLTSQLVDGGAPTAFAYDTAGNLTSNAESAAGVTTSTYDAGDRLTSITPPGATATTFSFDALGRHASRVTPAGTDVYEYVGSQEVVWRITTGAASVTSAVDSAGNRAVTSSGGVTGYLLPDLHGNFAAAVSPASAVINAIRYDGYGQTIDDFSSSGIATPWRFQGRLDVSPDATTPLYDLSARHYSPGLGTFTSFDTVRGQIAEPLSMNRYLYAHASPSTLTDPTGHSVDGGIGNCMPRCPRPAPPPVYGPTTPTAPVPVDRPPVWAPRPAPPPVYGPTTPTAPVPVDRPSVYAPRPAPPPSQRTNSPSPPPPTLSTPSPQPGAPPCPVAECIYTPPTVPRRPNDIQDLHDAASICGFILPFCDAIDGLVYGLQSKWLEAGVSGLSIVPWGDVAKPLRGAGHVVNGTSAGFRWNPAQGTPVIGRLDDTNVVKHGEWADHAVVQHEGWSAPANEMWIDSIIEQRGVVYLASEPSGANLIGTPEFNGGLSMFAVELHQLYQAGYSRLGDYLVPPAP